MSHNLTGRRYDDAQTEGLRQRDVFVDSILTAVASIRNNSGSLDVVADLLDDIRRDVTRAISINSDLQRDNVAPYDKTIVTCKRCNHKHEARHGCICKG